MSNLTTQKTEQKLQVFTSGTELGAIDNLSASDIQVPCLILVQKMTDLEGDYKEGDMVHSISGDTIGSEKDPLELVVADCYITQVWYEGKNWVKTLEWDESLMASDPYESDINGVKTKKQKCYNYVCFRALDIDEQQSEPSPMIVKFKGASGKFGRKFNTELREMALGAFKAPSWALTFNLTTHTEENEHGKFMVLEMKKGKLAIKEQQLAALALMKSWRSAKQHGEVQVVDSEEKVVSNDVPNHAPGVGSF